MAQLIELHEKKILEPTIKKKDGRPKSMKILRRNPSPRMRKL